ncbi:MAG: transketolase [Puniceicoccales bacterium]|jgi:transketolase|nr:transketolase [Puniceicoccales bacterium]
MSIPRELLVDLAESARIARGLAMDAVAVAKSGHLGLPLGCAEIGAALFGYLLHLNPEIPQWMNRDRFILSAGHGSMFLYAWLHLSGFALDDLSRFRTQGSNLPGHPEFSLTPGVECTTGVLGQGIANAVGFAIAKKMKVSRFSEAKKYLDYDIICLCSDGDLQEGISHEACSLAGHLGLDHLILIHDANGVTIDGTLDKSQSEDEKKRFEAYGFFVQTVDGHDIVSFVEAYKRAKIALRPSLIIAKTIIGRGIGEVAGTPKAHGEGGIPFIATARKHLDLPDQPFHVSESVGKFFQKRRLQWQKEYDCWLQNFTEVQREYGQNFPRLEENEQQMENGIEEFFFEHCKSISMREAGGEILNKLADKNSKIISGSADLFNSNKNYLFDRGDFSAENGRGRNIAFGIREHAMGGILNGIAYDGAFHPSGATFLAFSDYLRPAIRVAAMAKLPVVYIFTHDSIAVGQDGPTHQPVEILAALRCIPNLDVIRPANGLECIGAYEAAFSRKNGPTALILSRQNLPLLSEIAHGRKGTLFGAYIARDATENLKLIVLATGSELSLVLEATEEFKENVRVVSMPCGEIFERQSKAYQQTILPDTCPKRLAVEAGIAMPWHRYVGSHGKIISVDDFGFSAPEEATRQYFGFTVEHVREEIQMMNEKY